jgi:hypothetical protein
MKAKYVFGVAMLLPVLGIAPTLAQPPMQPELAPAPRAAPQNAVPSTIPPSSALVLATPPTLGGDPWINGPSQSWPVGRNGPILQEAFLYTGPTIPSGGGVLVSNLTTGWATELGGRSLFMNPQGTAAWTVSVGILQQYNPGMGSAGPGFTVPIRLTGAGTPFTDGAGANVGSANVIVAGYNRWSATSGVGREWFFGRANDSVAAITNFRLGVEAGGRWGTGHLDMYSVDPTGLFNNVYLRRQAIFESIYVAIQGGIDIPLGAATFFASVRGEFAFNWSQNITPTLDGTLFDANVLLCGGFRY